jgi:hypothetical protein
MSAGSGASNLGYSNISPNSNINSLFVNKDSSNWPGSFGSNEIQGTPPGPLPGLAGAKSNVDAAAGISPGICLFKGGAKKLKRKIKNITKQYKRMKAGSRKIKSMKKRIRSRAVSRSRSLTGGRRHSRRHSRRHRRQKGGYSQYQNNMPMTPTYQVAGVNLPYNQLGLANPPPITTLSNCTNCVDNYNHYSNMGFPSKGH